MLGSQDKKTTRDKNDNMSNPREKRTNRKARGPLAVGAYVPGIARPAFESHGFSTSSILSDWPEIIGPEFADITMPERISWPRGGEPLDAGQSPGSNRRSGATLHIRVDGPRAIEVQHMASQLLERVNIYFGYRAVAELRMVQGPVKKRVPSEPEQRVQIAPPRELDKPIKDDGLRAALERLGGSVKR